MAKSAKATLNYLKSFDDRRIFTREEPDLDESEKQRLALLRVATNGRLEFVQDGAAARSLSKPKAFVGAVQQESGYQDELRRRQQEQRASRLLEEQRRQQLQQMEARERFDIGRVRMKRYHPLEHEVDEHGQLTGRARMFRMCREQWEKKLRFAQSAFDNQHQIRDSILNDPHTFFEQI